MLPHGNIMYCNIFFTSSGSEHKQRQEEEEELLKRTKANEQKEKAC
jgi:hypothetical protein